VWVADVAHAYARGFRCAVEAGAQAQARRMAAAGVTFAAAADRLHQAKARAQFDLCGRDLSRDRLAVALRACELLAERTSDLIAVQASRSVVISGV
jgi:hypothetical protein